MNTLKLFLTLSLLVSGGMESAQACKARILLCILAICCFPLSIYSAHKITGHVTDSSQNQNIKKGNYILSVSCVGYADASVDFAMPEADFHVPPIALKENSIALDAVTVTANAVIQKKDRLLIIPDKQQIKHAYTGYDLLYNLMIPGVSVDRRQGTVSTSKGKYRTCGPKTSKR